MKQQLHIAPKFALPPAIATQAISVLGIRGSGKTNTAGVLAEELLTIGQPVVVIDPTDAWWGLRSSADGKSPGFPILICGGNHGDLPLTENDGKALAEFLAREQVSAILSIRHLRKEAQRRFFVALAEELYHLKGRPENRSALTLVIDEASSFVPQDVRGDVARSAGAVEDIVNRGRNVGFGMIMINQRAATLNKNVLTQCDTLVIHRMPSPQDRKAIRDWIEENATDEQAADVLASIAKLKTGEAWVWSPALDVCSQVQVRLKNTFDSSRTPGIGEAPRQPKRLAEIDLEQLKGKMASSIELAKASDPKLLKARIAELEAAAKKATPAKADPAAVDRAVASATKQALATAAGERKGLERKLGQAAKVIRQICGLLSGLDLSQFNEVAQAAIAEPKRQAVNDKATSHQDIGRPARIPPRAPQIGPAPANIAADGCELGKAERTVLTACYWLKDETTSPAKVQFFSGYSLASSTMDRALGTLRKGLLNGWAITREGIDLVESWGVEPKPAGRQLREMLRGKLERAENAVLDALMDAYPDRVMSEDLAAAAGYTTSSSTWDRAIGKLRTIEAAVGYDKDGGIKAADVFFDEGAS